MKQINRKPLMMFGLMVMVGIMIGAMIVIMIMFSQVGNMGQIIFGTSLRSMIIIPLTGFIIMLLIMFFFIRKMIGRNGPMSMMMGHDHNAQQKIEDKNLTVLNYNIPAVSCSHCKATIEREVGKLSGVASVAVDVDSKQAVIKIISPPTSTEIEALLTRIGFSPKSQ
ncbi:MAG: Heavy metal transport/detoxification protein [Dehalococcoidia bacterium]|nr:Heavy metal transport/detoxification protein [Dehalococcoidia bacterium]